MEIKTEIKKRKRAINWDELEKALLKECLKEFISIIGNKCTDTNTNKKKTNAWQTVTQRFNEMSNRERSLSELKQQWRTMKMEARKSCSNYKKALKSTGGGMKPPSPDQNLSQIMTMIPQEFKEDNNQFDSDRILVEESRKSNINIINDDQMNLDKAVKESQSMEMFIIHSDQTNTNNDVMNVSKPVQEATTEKEKYVESLVENRGRNKRAISKKIISDMCTERNKVLIKNITEEHILKMQHISEAHAWAKEEHELKIKKIKLEIMLLEKQCFT